MTQAHFLHDATAVTTPGKHDINTHTFKVRRNEQQLFIGILHSCKWLTSSVGKSYSYCSTSRQLLHFDSTIRESPNYVWETWRDSKTRRTYTFIQILRKTLRILNTTKEKRLRFNSGEMLYRLAVDTLHCKNTLIN